MPTFIPGSFSERIERIIGLIKSAKALPPDEESALILLLRSAESEELTLQCSLTIYGLICRAKVARLNQQTHIQTYG
jgi:hypothetical protein